MRAPRAGEIADRPSARPGTGPDDEGVDEEVTALLLQGDERWLSLAHRRWSGFVHSYASRVLGDWREAEDVTQQVFLAAWRGRAGFHPDRGTLPAWLMGITRRKTADALSARTRRREIVDAADRYRFDEPVQGADQVIDRIVVTGELERLPPPQRDVLALFYFADLTQVQISERTGMPLGTVKSHARRGVHRLRLRAATGAVEPGR
ncbi:RNA polymerase sigma factor [Streptomyces sp. NPDC086023]|uniref:RNA polymerase sigma factor n=1 Tax=Streptomyces sp. NPDC086023 TaxID=3365746 RepID=UPI0037D4FA3B